MVLRRRHGYRQGRWITEGRQSPSTGTAVISLKMRVGNPSSGPDSGGARWGTTQAVNQMRGLESIMLLKMPGGNPRQNPGLSKKAVAQVERRKAIELESARDWLRCRHFRQLGSSKKVMRMCAGDFSLEPSKELESSEGRMDARCPRLVPITMKISGEQGKGKVHYLV